MCTEWQKEGTLWVIIISRVWISLHSRGNWSGNVNYFEWISLHSKWLFYQMKIYQNIMAYPNYHYYLYSHYIIWLLLYHLVLFPNNIRPVILMFSVHNIKYMTQSVGLPSPCMEYISVWLSQQRVNGNGRVNVDFNSTRNSCFSVLMYTTYTRKPNTQYTQNTIWNIWMMSCMFESLIFFRQQILHLLLLGFCHA